MAGTQLPVDLELHAGRGAEVERGRARRSRRAASRRTRRVPKRRGRRRRCAGTGARGRASPAPPPGGSPASARRSQQDHHPGHDDDDPGEQAGEVGLRVAVLRERSRSPRRPAARTVPTTAASTRLWSNVDDVPGQGPDRADDRRGVDLVHVEGSLAKTATGGPSARAGSSAGSRFQNQETPAPAPSRDEHHARASSRAGMRTQLRRHGRARRIRGVAAGTAQGRDRPAS